MIRAQLQVMNCLHEAGKPLDLQYIYHQFKSGKYLPLSEEALGETYGQAAFTHEIRSTLNALKRKGYVENPARGLWALSTLGHAGMAKLDKRFHEVAEADRLAVLNQWEDFMTED
jgi:hypothetical protein